MGRQLDLFDFRIYSTKCQWISLEINNENTQVCIVANFKSQLLHLDNGDYKKSSTGKTAPVWIEGPELDLANQPSNSNYFIATGVVSSDRKRFFFVNKSKTIYSMACFGGKCDLTSLPLELKYGRGRPALIYIPDSKDLKKC